MHHAHRKTSDRLRRVFRALKRAPRKGLTTRGLELRANVCAVSACISELRADGVPVECRREAGLFWYRLGAV